MRPFRGLMTFIPILMLQMACQQSTSQNPTTAETTQVQVPAQAAPAQSAIERGKYLTLVGGCNDCHTPKTFGPNGLVPDMTRELSGHPSGDKLPALPKDLIGPKGWGAITNNHFTAWSGPWGVSFAMNLTPDKLTGLGTWTPDVFVSAIRTGKHMGAGRPILPPMPWPWYSKLTDDDLKAIFAYLQTLKPVNNPIPEPLPPGSGAQ
jgi:cytochrome c553